MATVLQKLKDEGWFIGEEGLKKISENGTITDVKELVKRALDTDLRDIVVNGGLGPDFSKGGKLDLPQCGIVLQVLNIRNVSAPKANQESKTSPRLLQIDLTDGQTLCSGLEMEHISAINLNVAPGTKVVVRNPAKLVQGMISFGPQNISILGGHVEALYEKWEINRTLAKYAQGARRPAVDGKGPPPWIPFGQKITQAPVTANDKSFKSLGAGGAAGGEKAKDPSKENSEFIATRNEAIAEANKIGGTKKVFGGGNRQLMDHNVKKILDKGYTEEQAKYALKLARNNLERAMSNLKRRNVGEDDRMMGDSKMGARNSMTRGGDDRPGGGRRGAKAEAAEMAAAAKPTGKVSLFDFLEDKIKIAPFPADTAASSGGHVHGPSPPKHLGKPTTSINQNFKQNHGHSSNNRYNQRNDGHQSQLHQPNSIDNRSKFENNISSSFASRQKKDDNVPYHNKTNNYNSNRPNNPKWNESAGPPQQGGNYAKKPSFPAFPPPPHQQHPPPPRQNNNYEGNKFHANPKYHNNGGQQQHQPPLPPPQNNSNYYNNYPQGNNGTRYSGLKNASHDNHQYNNESNNKGGSATQQHRTTNERKAPQSAISKSNKPNMNELIDATASLKIGSNPKHQSASSQSHHNQNKNSFEDVFPQAPKGFAYNPYKIMGFQNKETNEFAMNVLKTQVVDQSHAPPIHVPKPPQPSSQPPPPIHAENFVPMHQQPPIHHIYNGPPQMTHTMPNFIVTGGAIPPNIPQPPSYTWNWNVGDRCIAKYWEDGRYYNAEINAVTEKTCVVHFLEYGNYEEVVLSDCLPITDSNNQSVNHYNGNMNPPPPPQPTTPHQVHYQIPHNVQPPHHHYPQQQQQQRFRNDRKMYVPPAQRK